MTTSKPNNGPATEDQVALERRYDISPEPVKENKLVPQRPRKFSAVVKRKILVALQLGVPPSTAAAHAGISEKTLYNWWHRGQMAGPDSEGADLELYEFSEDCKMKRAGGEVGLVSIIWAHAQRNPQTAIQLLTKLYPDKYGNKVQHEVKGKIEHEHKRADYSDFTDAELEEMERLALKAQREKLKEDTVDAEIIE